METKVKEEHRKLFTFKPSSSVQRPGPSQKRRKLTNDKVFIPVRNTWTHKFFLFGSNLSKEVPTSKQKLEHGIAGLGDRDIVFQKDGNAEHVKTKILEVFPCLKYCGGFEIMRIIAGSSKILEVVTIPPGGYDVQFLKSCLMQAKAYIRPIQKSLSLEPIGEQDKDNKYEWPQEKCLTCGELMSVNILRQHTETCNSGEENNGSSEKNNPSAVKITNTVDLTKGDDENPDHVPISSSDTDSTLEPDVSLAHIMDIFPDKEYREIQRTYSRMGSVEATVAALLEEQKEDDTMLTSVFETTKTSENAPSTPEAFRRHWSNPSLQQPIIIDRQSPKPLRDIFKLYKKGLNIRGTPDVEFKGEDGTDASGPTREYFHLHVCMSLLASGDSSVHLFEGEPDHLVPIHCVESLDSMLFYYAGLMISHSFLHDGYPLIGVSKAVAAYIITGSVDEAIPYLSSRDIPDCEIREILEQVRKAETEEEFKELNSDNAVVNTLVAAGFVNKLITKSNRDAACERIMIHFALITRKLEMDDIRRGMEQIYLASFLQKSHHLLDSHIFPRVNDITVSGDSLVKNIALHPSVNDILDKNKEKTFQWLKEYVSSLPVCENDPYSPTTGRFLQFVLGTPQYPVQPVYIKFNRKEKPLPDPEACLGVLSIPTDAKDFNQFKQKMNITISAQATGYGRF